MVEMVKDLLVKFRSQILYLFFGVLTTVVNIVVYALLRMTDMPVQVSYWLAWFITVLVAYLTNRKWVFNSQASTPREYLMKSSSSMWPVWQLELSDLALCGLELAGCTKTTCFGILFKTSS